MSRVNVQDAKFCNLNSVCLGYFSLLEQKYLCPFDSDEENSDGEQTDDFAPEN